jgi:hypothetical protein
MIIPPETGLSVKAWNPDKTDMGQADEINGPAGNSALGMMGEQEGSPRGLRPCRAARGDYPATREVWQWAWEEGAG